MGLNHKCLMKNDEVIIKLRGMAEILIDRKNWEEAVKAFRYVTEGRISEALALMNLNLCPIPLISSFAVHVSDLYMALGGMPTFNCPDQYYGTAAIRMASLKFFHSVSMEFKKELGE
jgi:hypothetical protein